MTEKEALKLAAIGGALLNEVYRVWVIKRVLMRFTNRGSWGDALLLAGAARVLGAWAEMGRNEQADIRDRIRDLDV